MIHVGAMHREKTDEFMEKYFGGRWIEADFITLMLQRAVAGLTDEFCELCNLCAVGCPVSRVVQGFSPRQLVSLVKSGQTKELLKSDIIWKCASCLSCKERCPAETSPYEIIRTYRNLSARIGYHLPKGYREFDRRVTLSGIIQEPKAALTRNANRVDRADLGLPDIDVPVDKERFAEAIRKLSSMKVIL
jgi:heterodisulfide reductase subunit C